MGMKTLRFRGVLCCIMASALLFTGLVCGGGLSTLAAVESVNGSDSLVRTSLTEIKNVLTSISYTDYLAMYESSGRPDETVDIDIFGNINGDETNITYQVVDGAEYGKDGKVLLIGDDGKISFNINIKTAGFYNILVEYYTGNISVYDADGNLATVGKNASIERMVMIDGKVPFKEARSISFSRAWADSYPELDGDYKVVKTDGNKTYYDSTSTKFFESVANGDRIFQRDNNGNEMKPEKTIVGIWYTKRLFDSSGYSNEPLMFHFENGEHVISLNTVREPFAVKSIKLVPIAETVSYEEYLAEHKNAKDYSGDDIIIQAEYPSLASDRTLYQLNDRTSVISQPQDSALIRLNSIGGDKWTYVGQWIEYTFEAPEDGFYYVVPRSIQNVTSGKYVSRKIYINGEVPFTEANYTRFDFSDTWKTDALNDGTTEFKFFLNKGINTIRLEVALGDLAGLLSTIETSLNTCNSYYRKILMITGPDPDEYRDYRFERLMPEVLKGMLQQVDIINNVSDQLAKITGGKGESAAALEKVTLTLERMGKYPDKIASQLSTLKDYLAALGSWLTDMQSQPLQLDYIAIQAPSAERPKADAGFWDKFIGEIEKFFVSFFSDYTSVSSSNDQISSEDYEKAGIEVWTTSSRDHAQIIRSLVDDDFMERYNIPVTVKLVTGGTLLPATLAGTGPDISMGSDQTTPVNYAIRSAVLALNSNDGGYDFNDFTPYKDNPVYKDIIDDVDTFDEVTKRFAPTAMEPLTLYGKSYGVPENMGFSMMFYRKDIIVELDAKVPDTWDEFNQLIYTLQSNTMDIGFPTGVGGSTILMYQQDEPMYDMGNYDYYLENYPELFADGKNTYTNEDGEVIPQTDGMTINLDSDIALSTFKQVCRYFTMYDFPVSYSFADRFRNGTMPLAITDYTTYNTLIVFAPEIKGLWEFTPLPGTIGEDGVTINNTSVASVSAMMLMRTVKDDNAFSAWIFMQWWTSAKIQAAFANEMEALLGPSAKQNTANLEALESMSWSKDELDNLKAQFNAVKCTPEFPGSYIIGRYTNFAFLGVYNDGAEPVTKMQSYIVDINNELTRKRKEFNLITSEDIAAYDKTRSDGN